MESIRPGLGYSMDVHPLAGIAPRENTTTTGADAT